MTSWASPKVVEFKNRESLVSPLRVKAPVVASRVKLPAVPSEYSTDLGHSDSIVGLRLGEEDIDGFNVGLIDGFNVGLIDSDGKEEEEEDGDKDGL